MTYDKTDPAYSITLEDGRVVSGGSCTFAVTANETPLSKNTDGTYSISDIKESQQIIITGIRDNKAPVIDSANDGINWLSLSDEMTFYTSAQFMESDENLYEVTVDGVRIMPVSGQYILSVKNNVQEIKATDKIFC